MVIQETPFKTNKRRTAYEIRGKGSSSESLACTGHPLLPALLWVLGWGREPSKVPTRKEVTVQSEGQAIVIEPTVVGM